MVFDSINVPIKTSSSSGGVPLRLDQFGCSSNYVSIASLYRPNEDYRLCGQRRGIKLVTTYNVVLINFITTGLSDPATGFSMIFRVIQQNSPVVAASPGSSSTPPPIAGVTLAPVVYSSPPPPPPTTTTLAPHVFLTSPQPPARLNPLVTTTTNRFVRSMGKKNATSSNHGTLNKTSRF